MIRVTVLISLILFLSNSGYAYTLILKNGKILQVESKYKLINDVAMFIDENKKTILLSLSNINIAATELANLQKEGDFLCKTSEESPNNTDSTKLTNDSFKSNQDIKQNNTKAAHSLTNEDFEVFKQEYKETTIIKDEKTPSTETPKTQIQQNEDSKKQYWQERARQLLTELTVQEELVHLLQKQLAELEAYNRRFGYGDTNMGFVFPYNRQNNNNIILLPNQTQNIEQERKFREKLFDAQLQLSATQIRYGLLQDEARRAGIPPGWVR